MARYDYGLRGYRETARRRRGRSWHLQPSGEDPRDQLPRYRRHSGHDREYEEAVRAGWWPVAHRVTERYNRDYVHPGSRDEWGLNYNPYGGDTPWRIGDYSRFDRPYITKGGSYTYRGGRSVGWERDDGFEPGPYVRRWREPRVYDYGPDYPEDW